MKLNNAHKALAITFLIVISVVLSLFNYAIVKTNNTVAETLIDITPPDLFNDPPEEILESENIQKTNKAFNEADKNKHFAQVIKPIAPPKDYDASRLRNRIEPNLENKPNSKHEGPATIDTEALSSFKSVNTILKKRLNATQQSTAKAQVNKSSSIYYSLKGRTDRFLPVPIYLCESNGKIIVNITVNGNGVVTSTAINSASTSTNNCLQKQALDYAKKARFDPSTKATQIGTITFNFKGKN